MRLEDAFQGKAGYMSPEQAHGEVLDARSDVFAAGIMLWELCAGRRLYKAKQGESLLEVARRADVPLLPVRGCPAEEELHAIVFRALAKRREDRYPSARAMLRDIERYAYRAKLMTTPSELGTFLHDHFAAEFLPARKVKRRVVEAVERGPVAIITPLASPIRRKPMLQADVESPESNPSPPSSKIPASGVRRKRPATTLAPMKKTREPEGGFLGKLMLYAAAILMGLVFVAVNGQTF
jgi:serine/threonine-protein kinase